MVSSSKAGLCKVGFPNRPWPAEQLQHALLAFRQAPLAGRGALGLEALGKESRGK